MPCGFTVSSTASCCLPSHPPRAKICCLESSPSSYLKFPDRQYRPLDRQMQQPPPLESCPLSHCGINVSSSRVKHRIPHSREEEVDPNGPDDAQPNEHVVVILSNVSKGTRCCLIDFAVVSRRPIQRGSVPTAGINGEFRSRRYTDNSAPDCDRQNLNTVQRGRAIDRGTRIDYQPGRLPEEVQLTNTQPRIGISRGSQSPFQHDCP